MDFGAIKVFEAVLAAAGWKTAVAILVGIVVLIKLGPQLLIARREEQSDKARQMAALQARVDSKDATLEKILTNHIAHLELQLEASRGFYTIATERLAALSDDLHDARAQLDRVHSVIVDVKSDTEVLRDR